jgi:hypothetical protein
VVELVVAAIQKATTPGLAGVVQGLSIFVLMAAALITWGVRAQRKLRQQGYDPKAPMPLHWSDHTFDPERSSSFRGGCRVGQVNATWPLVTLTLDHEWVHLGGYTAIWVPRSAVARVEAITVTGGPGIRFASPTGEFDAVIFWATNPTAVLAAFEWFGWPIDGSGMTTWDPPPPAQDDRSGTA